jgi:hypothetical protein
VRHQARLPALLLLVYPTVLVADVVIDLLRFGGVPVLADRLVLSGVFLATAIGVWHGTRWAHALALVLGPATAVILVLATAGAIHPEDFRAWPAEHLARLVLVPASVAIALTAAAIMLRRSGRITAMDDGSPRGVVQKAALAAFGIELVLMLAIVVLGVGRLDERWYQMALMVTQLPGVILLTAMRLCCGVANELVLTDAMDPHWGGLTAIGIPILTVANALGLLPLTLLAAAAWRWRPRALATGNATRPVQGLN